MTELPVRGERSPIEAEHDLPTVVCLEVELVPGFPFTATDDSGRVIAFASWEYAAATAEHVAAATLPGHPEEPLLERVEPYPCWRGHVAEAILRADGREPADLSDDDLDELVAHRTFLLEATCHSHEDALEQTSELAASIVRGLVRRSSKSLDDPT